MAAVLDPDKLSKFSKLEKAKVEFSKRRKVLLNNIPDGVDLEELKHTILEGLNAVEVTVNKQTVNILFKNTQEAEQSVKTLKSLNSDFDDRGITIIVPEPDSLLFVGNLPLEFTDEEFDKLMSQYGKLERVFLVRSEVNGESKGYGFAEYPDKKTAGDAKQQLLNSGAKYVSGRILRVDFAEPSLGSYKDLHSRTLFLDKLPRDFTDGEALGQLFSKSGTVTFAQVAVHPQSGTSRGFAFVDYATSEEAEKGQKAHNGATVGHCKIRTSFGTPGRLGATVLGPSSSNIAQASQLGSLMSVSPNTLIRAPPFRLQLSAQQINAQVMPLMAAMPMIDPRAQLGMHRFPDPRLPIPLMRPEMGGPRGPFFPRPMFPRPGFLGMGGPRPHLPIGTPRPHGPRPLMIGGPHPMAIGPRGVPPRGIPIPHRPLVHRNGPVRSLVAESRKEGFQHSQEIKSVNRPPSLPARPQLNHTPSFSKAISPAAKHSPQPLMLSGTQSQQQHPHLVQNNIHVGQGLQGVQLPLQPKLSETRPLGNQFYGTQQSSGVYPGKHQLGLPGHNQQVSGGARPGSIDPAPLMSVSTNSTGELQRQGYSAAAGQAVPGQSAAYQAYQTPGQQSYLAQQSGLLQDYSPYQQGMGYLGQAMYAQMYQQGAQAYPQKQPTEYQGSLSNTIAPLLGQSPDIFSMNKRPRY